MIKANELRVGNHLYYKEEIIQVTTIGIFGIQSKNEKRCINAKFFLTPDLNGIPLTEQWLLDFGFDNGNKEMSNCDLWDKWWVGDFVLDKEPDDVFWLYFHNGITKLQYVHQLQNLYFALTGEELTLNAKASNR